jgi:site-specific recombinase XerC
MTSPVRSHKTATAAVGTWRELRSPDAANDVVAGLPALSRSLPRAPEELAQLRATLDLKQASDVRAAAMLVMLGLGLHKRELVALDVSDIVTIGSVVCVAVKSRTRRDKGKQTFLPVMGGDARVLRLYLATQQDEAAPLTSPLFYNIEHGREDRLARASANSISYWLLELRLRARAAFKRGRAPHVSEPKQTLGATRGGRPSRH